MRIVIAIALSLLVGACSSLTDWFGEAQETPLPGERISVVALEQSPEPDPRIADLQVRLPAPEMNSAWPQGGGYPSHAMQHLMASGPLAAAWRADIGDGASDDHELMSTPIVAEGKVYAIDAGGHLSAFEAESGKRLWRVDTLPEEDDDAMGGGIAFDNGRVFVTSGAGEIVAFDAKDGVEIWRASVGTPIRSSPTLSDGRVFAVTYDNQLFALDAASGGELWTNSGIAEPAQLLGSPSPAVAGGVVVVAYSSGEIIALRADNGRVVWSDALAFGRRTGAMASLNDINGSPVIDGDRVYAISLAGHLVAIDLRSGDRLWDQEVSSVQTPWIAGEFLFVLTTDGDIVCLSRRDGRIRWVRSLPRYEKPDKRSDPIFWSGPILVSDRLIVAGTDGEALAISPYDGQVVANIAIPGATELAPVAADGSVYVVTDSGVLVALR
jgi:outer membrane assembly lipoprotein YfgL